MKKLGFVFILLLIGCSESNGTQTNVNEENRVLYQNVIDVLQADEDVTNVNVVVADKKWLITYEMKPLAKWNKQKHLKKIKKELKELKGENDFIISNDYKLMLESNKLIQDPPKPEKLQKEVKKLKKLLEEET